MLGGPPVAYSELLDPMVLVDGQPNREKLQQPAPAFFSHPTSSADNQILQRAV